MQHKLPADKTIRKFNGRSKPPKGLRRQLAGYRRMLAVDTAKNAKGEKLGYMTGILFLSPATESGLIDMCLGRNSHCTKACLGHSTGHLRFDKSRASRVDKTQMFVENRQLFLECVEWDIGMVIRRAERLGLTPVFRVNGSSDRPDVAMHFARQIPHGPVLRLQQTAEGWNCASYPITASRSATAEQISWKPSAR